MRIVGSALIVLATIGAAVLPAQQAILPPSGTSPVAPVVVPPGTSVAAPSLARVFASEAGAVLSTVRADKVEEFEKVIEQVHAALARSTDPVRQAQAAGWKVFRATEAGPGASVLYLFVMDPAVTDADYTLSGILGEAFPADVRELFELYNGSVLSQSLLSLTSIARFGEPFRPAPAGKRRTPVVTPPSPVSDRRP